MHYIMFLVNGLVYKMSDILKNLRYNFPQFKLRFKNVLFYSTNSTKPKNILFTIMYDKEMREIITFENLEAVYIWHFVHEK